MEPSSSNFQSFDFPAESTPPGTQALPRPADRPRLVEEEEGESESEFVTFDFPPAELQPGSRASPRPAGRGRRRSLEALSDEELPSDVQTLLQNAFLAIPQEYRRILQLQLAGTPIADIAQTIGTTPERVLTALNQVREILERDPAA